MLCTVCSELAGKAEPYLGSSYKSLIESGRNILLNGENFVVLPSVGALNPSHALVVPREHLFSFSMLPQEQIIKDIPLIKIALRSVNHSKGVNVVFFEHGMGGSSDSSGACISHAHLHVIADIETLELNLRNSIQFVNIPSFAVIKDLASKEEGYVVFENALGNVGLSNRPDLPSQFFRRMYALTARKPAVWNWRVDRQSLYTKQVVEHYVGLKEAYAALTEH